MKSFRILVAVVLLLACGPANGQVLTTLYNFTGGVDGSQANGLVQGSDGSFYGTTAVGGLNGSGTVFKVTTTGTLTTLYHFGGPDGSQPRANLIQASDGNFYGTTYYGGTNGLGGTNDFGTIFKMTSAGTLTTLYEFADHDGRNPVGPLVEGSDGNFYGATLTGGTNISFGSHSYSFGTVFKMTPTGTLTTLRQFKNDAYGRCPQGLVASGDGSFYGTTVDSTIFKIDPTGTSSLLWTATAYGDPSAFGSPLVQGTDGNFYGIGIDGGVPGWGAIFKFNPSSTPMVTNLYNIPDENFYSPFAAIGGLGSDGNVYGTSWGSGTSTNCVWGCGTVFRVSPSGGLTTLWSFTDAGDGAKPFLSGLVQGTDGSFYGTTQQGGAYGAGTVFRIRVPLSSPADQISGIDFFNIFGSSIVAIRIPSVAGETYQLQFTDSLTPAIWLNTGGSVTSVGGPLILIDIPSALPPQRFYRAAITP